MCIDTHITSTARYVKTSGRNGTKREMLLGGNQTHAQKKKQVE